ncbi:MAG: hypothetical protein KBC05_00590 [Candidatus Hydrogenedentes bacterium]|nr:hypothetical protein [Candidatus Hydrogenedentota bacterium]
MSTEQLGPPGQQPAIPVYVSLLWNDRIIETILPVHRKSKVIRTKPVSPEKRLEYDLHGWPREHVLLYEHRLKLIGHDHYLFLITNAPEAEHEHPDRILTPVRGCGTFNNAKVFWQGRKDRAFVSIRHTHPRFHQFAMDLRKECAQPPAPAPDLAKNVTRSGILITTGKLPADMQPPERELANFLLAFKDSKAGAVYSLREIAQALKVGKETVRRRKSALESKYPALKGLFAAFRARNAKGEPLCPLPGISEPDSPAEEE